MEDLSIDSFSGFPGRDCRPLMTHPYRHMYTVADVVDQVRACGLPSPTCDEPGRWG
ncbi:hypothetical protein DSCA_40300 [Desulfosarcina alkanivorans]|jgi:hypothetical protein|uniref:Uncharacterized protein n=1 Tax=Desulfosarcina alkanivorans TaxID=571177 RepID=A0A5K7YP66_9BACT|nr:hypothetical protein [Desulfosarcina alkanivorans]BBO70100.1 hypothetical protein DSCA_40300 [Desulfosarcina alkanivorans]